MVAVLVNFINLFVTVFQVLILIRVIMSWVSPHPSSRIGLLIMELTDPLLLPIQKVLPKTQMFDFSPLVAFLLLQLLSVFANQLGTT
ncbi:MAG TPA: YggT family protein [Candidatus Saccharimonadia bacterium]